MKTIAIISQKGGAGKTTLAINLATAAGLHGHMSALIDLDPQASAKEWHDIREKDTPAVISVQPARLMEILETARENGADLCVIDTAPHSEIASLAAARESDLVVVPCRASILDIRAIATTVDLAALAKTPAVAVLNAVPARGTLADEAAEAIQSYGLEVVPLRLGHRSSFVHSLTIRVSSQEYEPHGKGSTEIGQLYNWLTNRINIES
ncbi:MAG: ParA family protein [Chlorobium limicola]|nr:ParA family protein [Chlorobium limicola]